MYKHKQREPVMNMAKWLGGMSWDIFSTVTYRHNVKSWQNYRIMTALAKYLQTLNKPFKMFWVTDSLTTIITLITISYWKEML